MDACFALLRQTDCFAAALAWAKTGKRMDAKIAMIAITTRSSIKVKAVVFNSECLNGKCRTGS